MLFLLVAAPHVYRNDARFSIGPPVSSRCRETDDAAEVIEMPSPALSLQRRRGWPRPQEMGMSALQAMAIAIAVRVCVGTILVAGLMTPLRAVLRRACPGPEGENFWTRFTDAGQLTQRVLSSALFGAFAALAGIGLRMGTLRTLSRA
jgi:hypothetical protein